MPSATAKIAIAAGMAVAQSGATASLAGGKVVATHIAQTGTPIGGVVSLLATGVLDLTDWTLAVGSKFLTSGASYTVGSNGRLVANGTGQAIGIATSPTTLSITVQTGQKTATTTSTSAQANAPTITPAQFITLLLQFRYAGSLALGNAVNNGSVSGIMLNFTPTRVLLTVRKPLNGLNLFATSVVGTISKTGFSFYLSGLTDSANYILDYEIS